MKSAPTRALFPTYGASELKRNYQRNLGLGVLIAGLLHIVVIGILFSGSILPSTTTIVVRDVNMPLRDTVETSSFEDPAKLDLEAPPSFTQTEPPPGFKIAETSAGIPKMVPTESLKTEVAIATQKELSWMASNPIWRPDLSLNRHEFQGERYRGNTIKLFVYLWNNGGDVSKVDASLSSNTSRVQVSRNGFSWDKISSGRKADNSSRPFKINLSSDLDAPKKYPLTLKLEGHYGKNLSYVKETIIPLNVLLKESEVELAWRAMRILDEGSSKLRARLQELIDKDHRGPIGNGVSFGGTFIEFDFHGTTYTFKFDLTKDIIFVDLMETITRGQVRENVKLEAFKELIKVFPEN